MTRVSNTDQVLLLLRQQLQRMSGGQQAKRAGKSERNRQPQKAAVARVKAMAQLGDLGADEFERTLIQGLLIDELGEAFINDPRFQKLVDKVLEMISSDAQSRQLLQNATRELMA